MRICIEINNCQSCRHVDHSGSFTIRGARQICGHSDACEIRRSLDDFKLEYPEYFERGDHKEYWKSHWYHRIVGDSIPEWCPLKYGSKY